MAGDPAGIARLVAEEVLFPNALATDRSPVVPVDRLDALAAAGLYGLSGPAGAGGLAATGRRAALEVAEILAGACLTTTLVWGQHHGAVRALRRTSSHSLRDEFLEPLCRGARRSGIAFSGLRRPGPPVLNTRRTDGGWRLDGYAPWVTGWGRIDVLYTAARDDAGNIVWALLDAVAGPTLVIEPLELAAVSASATVTVRFHDHLVPDSRVTSIQPFDDWAGRDAGELRRNGSLALGVATRCCSMLGPSPLDGELRACRLRLDTASREQMPAARASASDLAMRAASRLITAGGGRSILLDQHAQRLAREAMFLLVFGQTPSIRAAQLAPPLGP